MGRSSTPSVKFSIRSITGFSPSHDPPVHEGSPNDLGPDTAVYTDIDKLIETYTIESPDIRQTYMTWAPSRISIIFEFQVSDRAVSAGQGSGQGFWVGLIPRFSTPSDDSR